MITGEPDSLKAEATAYTACMSPARGTRGAVSSGHQLASLAGLRLLERGGNAVDAGVAAGLCLNVLQSDFTNLGGVAPTLIFLARERRVVNIDGLGHWPRAATLAEFKRRAGDGMPTGVLRTVTPAAAGAWLTALERYGTMTLAEVSEDARYYATHGFPMHDFMAALTRTQEHQYRQWPQNAAIYLPGGRPPRPGEMFRQEDLGRTLQYLVDKEQAASSKGREASLRAARDAFYKGDLAREMAKFHQAEGSLLTYEDLAAHEVREEEPVRVAFRDLEVVCCGPWCQGPVLAQMIVMLKNFPLEHLGHNSPQYIHFLTEVMKLAFADREVYYGDPKFVDVPLAALLSDAYAARRLKRVDPRRAYPQMPPPGLGERGGASADQDPTDARAEGDTSYACAVDAEGNAFSATPSDIAYTVPVVPGLGIIVSGRGSQSRTDAKHPSVLAPGKRPRLTPNPGLVLKDGRIFMPWGTPGGDVQPQAMLQVLLNIAVFGMEPQAAVEMPRFATQSFPNSFYPHEYLPNRLRVEASIPERHRRDLEEKGHEVVPWPALDFHAGAVCCIRRDQDTGVLTAAADPRRESAAVAR